MYPAVFLSKVMPEVLHLSKATYKNASQWYFTLLKLAARIYGAQAMILNWPLGGTWSRLNIVLFIAGLIIEDQCFGVRHFKVVSTLNKSYVRYLF